MLEKKAEEKQKELKKLVGRMDYYFLFRLIDMPLERIKTIRYQSLRHGGSPPEVKFDKSTNCHYIKVEAEMMDSKLGRGLQGMIEVVDNNNRKYYRNLNLQKLMMSKKLYRSDRKDDRYRLVYFAGKLRLEEIITKAVIKLNPDPKMAVKDLSIGRLGTILRGKAVAGNPNLGVSAQLEVTKEAREIYEAKLNGDTLSLTLAPNIAALAVNISYEAVAGTKPEIAKLIGQGSQTYIKPLTRPKTQTSWEWSEEKEPELQTFQIDLSTRVRVPKLPPLDPQAKVKPQQAAQAIDDLVMGAMAGDILEPHLNSFSQRWLSAIKAEENSGVSDWQARKEVQTKHLEAPIKAFKDNLIDPEINRLSEEAKIWKQDLNTLREESMAKMAYFGKIFDSNSSPPDFNQINGTMEGALKDPLGQVRSFEHRNEKPGDRVLAQVNRMLGFYDQRQNELQKLHTFLLRNYIPEMEQLLERREQHAEALSGILTEATAVNAPLYLTRISEGYYEAGYVKQALYDAPGAITAVEEGLDTISIYRSRLLRIRDNYMALGASLFSRIQETSNAMRRWDRSLDDFENLYQNSLKARDALEPIMLILSQRNTKGYMVGPTEHVSLSAPLNLDMWQTNLERSIEAEAWTAIENFLKGFRENLPSEANKIDSSQMASISCEFPAFTTLPDFLRTLGQELIYLGVRLDPSMNFEPITRALVRRYDETKNHCSNHPIPLFAAANGLDELTKLLGPDGRQIDTPGQAKLKEFANSLLISDSTEQQIVYRNLSLIDGFGHLSRYFVEHGTPLMGLADLIERAELAEQGGRGDWARKIRELVQACLTARTVKDHTQALNALYHPYRWRSGLDNDSGYNVMGTPWPLHPADDFLVGDINKAAQHFVTSSIEVYRASNSELEALLKTLETIPESQLPKHELADPQVREARTNHLLAPSIPNPDGRCIPWLKQTAERAGAGGPFEELEKLQSINSNLADKLRSYFEKMDQVSSPPPETDIDREDYDANYVEPSISTQKLYEKYIEAYNRLTSLMAAGKGDTDEAKRAYAEYEKKKKEYEAALKK